MTEGKQLSEKRRPQVTDPNSVRRTLLALLATGLGIIPLKGLFSDYGWLLDVWLTMIVVLGPAAFLRRRRPPGALDIWPGIVLMVPWLTLRFVRSHAIGGVLPGPATWHDISLLLVDLHKTTRDDVAPIHTTVAVRLVVCALLGLVAALVDLVAVVGRRGALAGVPLLIVYTVAGAVPRHPVSWIWFAFAAAGFLVLLGLDSEDVLSSWGRRIRPPRGSRGPNAVAVTTPRIAVLAVVVAIALPLLVPAQSRNLISNAFHGGSGGEGGIANFGGGSGGSIAPFAALKGYLDRKNPVTLMTVQMLGKSTTQPFYLRVNSLDDYTGNGFQAASHGPTDLLGSDGRPGTSRGDGFPFPTEPQGTGTAQQLQARISLTDQVRGNAPIFAVPTSVDGLSGDASWSAQDQLLLGQQITGSTEYTESFDQPEPTAEQLAATGAANVNGPLAPYLALHGGLPSYVSHLVATVAGDKTSAYARALAINNYFTNPKYGFTYSLSTKVGDSGSVLEDFLKNKQGYCQQYAAAEAVMLRATGIPSRVVLGYMHAATDSKRSFTVTTSDAHAWVEAYFPGQGWIPFDPTPSAGLVGNAKTDLPWARHAGLTSTPGKDGSEPTISRSAPPNAGKSATTAPSSAAPVPVAGAGGGSPTSLTPLWWTLTGLALVALVLAPAAARGRRRRSRFAAARHNGDAGALWAELSDTAVDLGYPWSTARTPRQVAGWLSRDAPSSAHWFSTLADAVERQRYSRAGPAGANTAALAANARSALGELGGRRTRSARLRAALWPASLQWGRFTPSRWFTRRHA